MTRRRALASLAAAFAVCLSAPPGQAIPLIGDQTIVLLTSDAALAAAGITETATGNAVLGQDLAGRAELLLPITGGDVDETTLSGTIEYAGSGILLSGVGATLEIANGVSDFDALVVTADVSVNGGPASSIPVFTLSQCSDLYGGPAQCVDGDGSILLDGWKLSNTEEYAALFTETFGIPSAAGTQAGVARIDIRPIPEPGTAVLLGLGLGVAAARNRRKDRG